MNILKSLIFIVCCLLFILHQALQKGLGYSLPIADGYIDSFLAMPIILTLLLWERHVLFRRGYNYRLSALETAIATLFIALISEVIFPWLSPKFTTDWQDLLFYISGSILFFFTINRKAKKQDAP